MHRQDIEQKCDRIEAAFLTYRVAVKVTGGTVTPRFVSYNIVASQGTRIAHIRGLHEELAACLDVSHVRITRHGAQLALEAPRENPEPVRLAPTMQTINGNIPSGTALLGIEETGAPLMLRLPSATVAHVLIAGTTGSGKTSLLHTIITSLMAYNPTPNRHYVTIPELASRDAILTNTNPPTPLGMIMIDPKGYSMAPFAYTPHMLRPTIDSIPEARECLLSLCRYMEHVTTPVPPQHIILVIDELADLLMQGGQDIQEPLTRILQRGRSAGIHVVAATQKPTAAVLGPLAKGNFPTRIVGKVASIEDARVAAGWPGTGAEKLLGNGDFLLVAEGQVIRFNGCYIPPDDLTIYLDYIRQAPPQPAQQPTPTLPDGSDSLALPDQDDGSDSNAIDELVARLQGHGWHTGTINSAFRLLYPGTTPGGRRYTLVKAAISRLQGGTSTSLENVPQVASTQDSYIFDGSATPVEVETTYENQE